MYHVVHLLFFFVLFCQNEKGLLNFASERIIFLKLVYMINNTRYSFHKNKLPFETSKTTFYRAHTFELKSTSKYQLLLHWKSFENWYMIFYTLPSCSRWNRTHTDVRWIRSEMPWSSIHTKIWTLKPVSYTHLTLPTKRIV